MCIKNMLQNNSYEQEIKQKVGQRTVLSLCTDGACLGNPGPGGWAVFGQTAWHSWEMAGRARQTTNNRMELMAALQGLRCLVMPSSWRSHDEEIWQACGAEWDESAHSHMMAACQMGAENVWEVTVFSDSQYVTKGMTSWLAGWQRNGWRTSQKKPVENQDLWQALAHINQRLQQLGSWVQWQWVRGHAGHAGNERVDALAQQAARQVC